MTARIAVKPPRLSDFPTWVNRSIAEVAQLGDALRIYADTSSPNAPSLMCRVRPIPSGAFDVQLACVRGFMFKDFQSGGLVLYESATQKLVTFGFGTPSSDGIALQKRDAPASSGTTIETAAERNVHFQFFRAALNGSTIAFYHALDGKCWSHLHAMEITAHFSSAPDRWGFYIENNNSTFPALDQVMDVIHWSE